MPLPFASAGREFDSRSCAFIQPMSGHPCQCPTAQNALLCKIAANGGENAAIGIDPRAHGTLIGLLHNLTLTLPRYRLANHTTYSLTGQ